MIFSFIFFFFFKQKTAYEMLISDWSSDVCSSDLVSSSISFAMSTPRTSAPSAAPRRRMDNVISYLLSQYAVEEARHIGRRLDGGDPGDHLLHLFRRHRRRAGGCAVAELRVQLRIRHRVLRRAGDLLDPALQRALAPGRDGDLGGCELAGIGLVDRDAYPTR